MDSEETTEVGSDPVPTPTPELNPPTLEDKIRYLGTVREHDAALVDVLMEIAHELDKLRHRS